MNDLFKYGLFAVAGYFGIRYYNAYQVAKKLTISYTGFSLNSISNNNVQLGFWLSVENPTTDNLNISNSTLKIYLNGSYAGNCTVPYVQVVKASSTTKIYVVCNVAYKSVFANFWDAFLQASTSVTLTIAGNLRFNGVYCPVPAINIKQFSLKDALTKLTD